jgi:hypothetical protein
MHLLIERGLWSPTGKARGTLANAHVGRHFGHIGGAFLLPVKPGGLLLPE